MSSGFVDGIPYQCPHDRGPSGSILDLSFLPVACFVSSPHAWGFVDVQWCRCRVFFLLHKFSKQSYSQKFLPSLVGATEITLMHIYCGRTPLRVPKPSWGSVSNWLGETPDLDLKPLELPDGGLKSRIMSTSAPRGASPLVFSHRSSVTTERLVRGDQPRSLLSDRK